MPTTVENESNTSAMSHDIEPYKSTVAMSCGGILFFVDGKYVIVHDDGPLSINNDKLIEVASKCAVNANLCLQYCTLSLSQGDRKIVDCAKISRQVVAICSALALMAKVKSRNLFHLASIAKDMCNDCEQLCMKFDRHTECKACGDACNSCKKECDLIQIRAQFGIA